MAKITLTDLTNLQNETTAVSKINLNNSLVETAIENTLSRDGSSPNMMGANLDMNSNRILNLPAPSDNTEPVRRYDLDVAIKGIVDFQNTLTEKVSEASDYATQAETSAVSAYSSYVLASAYADSLNAVSTTSNAIENGSKVFSIQTGKQFKNGQYVLISYTQDVTKYLYGYVTDYTGSSLTVQVVATQGSGTYADWTIGLSAIRGPQGEVGPKGDTGAQGLQGLQGPTGNTGPSAWAAPVAWQTGQSYTASAPASVVTQGGETYVCIISHTSGTFATDLAASKWLKIAAKGADGSGTGDMLKADNLSGLANVATARANLGATTVGDALFTAVSAEDARTIIGSSANAREVLTANRTYYVSTSGNDANNGLSSGTAFATIQKAIDVVGSLDTSVYNVTISCSAGTFAPISLKDPIGAGKVEIIGAGATTIISATSNNAIQANNSTKYKISSLKVTTTTSGHGIFAYNKSVLTISGITFGPCAQHHINSNFGSIVTCESYSIVGGSVIHWCTDNMSSILAAGITITITGTPSFSGYFASAVNLSLLRVNSNTFSGSATGTRYYVSANSVLYTEGGSATYLPGSSAGSTAAGGQYL